MVEIKFGYKYTKIVCKKRRKHRIFPPPNEMSKILKLLYIVVRF